MSPVPAFRFDRPTLLVAEGTPAVLKSMCDVLEKDYELCVASTGAEALALVASTRLDLVIVDVALPEVDGYEICRRLKADPATEPIPVLYLAERTSEQDKLRGLELGGADFVFKPFSPPLVQARVRNLVNLKRSLDERLENTYQDDLTDLPNHRRLDETLAHEWHRAARYRRPLALALVDVDHLEDYNEHLGRAEGDLCLHQVARVLQGSVHRPTDMLARYAGGTFACILPETDHAGALLLAERFREAVEALGLPHPASRTAQVVTVSVGLEALIPSLERGAESLLEAAGERLRQAKAEGRNRVGHREGAPTQKAAAPSVLLESLPLPTPADLTPRILMVEDDKHMRLLLGARLEFLQAQVDSVASAEEALKYLAAERPDLILSDAVMPGMDGFMLCQRVKTGLGLRDVPFVILTSLTRNLRERAMASGADDYLSKMEDDLTFRLRSRFLLELGCRRTPMDRPLELEGVHVLLLSTLGATRAQMEAQLRPDGYRLTVAGDVEAAATGFELLHPQVVAVDLDPDGESWLGWLERLHAAGLQGHATFIGLASKDSEGLLPSYEPFLQDRMYKPLEAQNTRHRLRLLVRLALARG